MRARPLRLISLILGVLIAGAGNCSGVDRQRRPARSRDTATITRYRYVFVCLRRAAACGASSAANRAGGHAP